MLVPGAKRRRARDRIQDVPLLRGLTSRDLVLLSRYADAVSVDDGHFLARHGDAPNQLLILVRGGAVAETTGSSRRTLGPGDVVGIQILSGGEHAESVIATGAAEVLVIGRRQLAGLLRVAPSFSVALLQYAAERLAQASLSTRTGW
jgi:CRP-like cAMP-binding protein